MIHITHLTKRFGEFVALDDVSIHIPKGHIHGIIGENGAGKTTLLQCLVGIYAVEEGTIQIAGESPWENDAIKAKTGYVADRTQYFKGYKVSELIQFYKEVYPTFDTDDFHRYNKAFAIPLTKKVRQLSKGMQMRLSFMLNLAIHPEVLVLDEPTSGLDAIAKKHLLDFLIDEVAARGMTVVISSHHLSELEKVCDTITMIHGAKVSYNTTTETLKEQIKKLQVVFTTDAPSDLASWPELLAVEQVGRVYYLVTSNYNSSLEEKLHAHGIQFIETIGLTLEEIFIYANQTGGGQHA